MPSNNYLEAHPQQAPHEVYFVTDSLSFLLALRKGPVRQHDYYPQRVWEDIGFLCEQRLVRCFFVFIFSHAGVPGNEFADDLAEDWRNAIGDSMSPLWLTDSRRFRVGAVRTNHDTEGMRVDPDIGLLRKPTGPSASLRRFRFTRKEESLLFRARLGVYPSIGGNTLDAADACPMCGEDGVLHPLGNACTRHIFYECTAVKQYLVPFIGQPPVNLHHVLWSHPRAALTYLQLFERARGAAAADGSSSDDDEHTDDDTSDDDN